MKQLSLAVASYLDVHKHYPPPYLADKDGKPMHSWRVLILPYIEEGKLYKEYRFDEPWNGPNNRKLAARMPRVYAIHGEERPGNTITNYLAVVGPETLWQGPTGVRRDAVKDGTSHTILLVENKGAQVHWMEPRDLSLADMEFILGSPKGVSSRYVDPAVAMADSTVRRLANKLTPATLRALLTIQGGEALEGNDLEGWQVLKDGRKRPVAKDPEDDEN